MKKFLFSVFLTFIAMLAEGQNMSVKDSTMNSMFLMNVSSISEFMSRFNNESSHPALTELSGSVKAKRNLLALFDMKSAAIKADEPLVMAFAEDVTTDSCKIQFSDSLWFAEAQCAVKYEGKEYMVTLVFETEKIGEGHLRWVLSGAGDIYGNLVPESKPRIIDPTDNELDFLVLRDRFKYDTENAFGYIGLSAVPDQLSILLTLVSIGKVEFIAANSIVYHFLNVPGYAFIVSPNERKSSNSGWLITSLSKMTDSEKYNYIKLLLNS